MIKSDVKPVGWFCIGLTTLFSCQSTPKQHRNPVRPNILIVMADQWRAMAFGYTGNTVVKTPNIDKLASESIVFTNAVSGVPVCCPARASLMTGQRSLTNGVFMNDVQLDTNAVTLAKVMAGADYQTAITGKWHLDGHGRSSFIPPGNRRQGFQYWKANECTHDYNHSIYYSDTPDTLYWEGYDAISQTKDACLYIRRHASDPEPFMFFLSWGPPHAPYETAPKKYRAMYSPEMIRLQPNVPDSAAEAAKENIAGYYAHCTALDDMVGQIRQTLEESGIAENTIIVFLSDHGDLLGSHSYYKKQQPYDESIRIPMIFYVPEKLGGKPGNRKAMINLEDVMPTILGLCSVKIPSTVEGTDYSDYIHGGKNPGDTVTLISCVQPFGQWSRSVGGREYRGLRSLHYTYVRDLKGPWLFFDDIADPFQMNNLVTDVHKKELVKQFDDLLTSKLISTGDKFLPGLEYVRLWKYPPLNADGTVSYH